MIWNKLSSMYDFFEVVYNGKVYKGIGQEVAQHINNKDLVLECACGTGAISLPVAQKCRHLTATDMADGMLRQARKKLSKCSNVTLGKADITHLEYPDNSFDKVIAGNVIHLLDNPQQAVNELLRVCRPGGQVIIPTYINVTANGSSNWGAKFVEMLGVRFPQEYNLETYQTFFAQLGFDQVEYTVVEGRMPCAIAVISRKV